MTDPFVADDVLEAVLRSRAGDGAPADLHALILAAVAVDGPRSIARRSVRHPWRLLAVAAVLTGTIGTALFVGGSRQTAVTPTPGPTGPAIPALTQTFTSPRAGYSVGYPAGWQVAGATAPWRYGRAIPWGDPALDIIQGGDLRFAAASQPLGPDQADTAWYRANCATSGILDCTTAPADWIPTTIGGKPGYIDVDGESGAGGIAAGGRRFDAVVVDRGRGYEFMLGGRVDRTVFESFLASISLTPDEASDLPVLTGTFTSPAVGYSIGLADGWTTLAGATSSAGDEITIGGTDTTVYASSKALQSGDTFDAFLQSAYQGAFGAVPAGCEGGDPSTWPTIAVGPEQGRLQMLCNAATVHVLVGGRVYDFGWGNANFIGADHLSLPSWEALLKAVTFDPASAR